MVVYGDLLFLINFSMDFLSFYFLCLLLHKRLPTLRVCIASIVGGIYSVASLFLGIGREWSLILDISVPVLMCIIAFASKKTGWREIIKTVLLYFFVSALLGGLMTALFYLFNRIDSFAQQMGADEGIDVWIFAILTVVSSIFTLKGGSFFRSSAARREGELVIFGGGEKSVKLRTLIDSGNLVREPISERAVAFASLEACAPLLDPALVDAVEGKKELESLPFSILSGVRLVPSKTIAGETVVPAIRFKRAVLRVGKSFKELDIYIALVCGSALGGYEAVISHEAA